MVRDACADELEKLRQPRLLYTNEIAEEDTPREESPRELKEEHILGMSIGWLGLIFLMLQTTFQAFIIKLARKGETNYLNSSTIVCSEVLKTLISFAMESHAQGSLRLAAASLANFAWAAPVETCKWGVPALLYWMQTYFMFYSLDKLSMAVQQATYQLKIFTTAVLSILVLGRTVTPVQWVAIFLLIVGVMLVQLPSDFFTDILDGAEANGLNEVGAIDPDAASRSSFLTSDTFLGVVAVLLSCLCSGGAGVYQEKMLKECAKSLWFQSVFLGIFGIIVASAGAFVGDAHVIVKYGFFAGFTWQVHVIVWTVALGGLLCAIVIKYADNILRQFSTAVSLLITIALSALILRDVVLGINDSIIWAQCLLMPDECLYICSCTFSNSGLADGWLVEVFDTCSFTQAQDGPRTC